MCRTRHSGGFCARVTHHTVHASGVMAFLPEQSTIEGMATLLMVRRLYPRLREEQRSDPQSQVHGDYHDGRDELPIRYLLYREDMRKGDRIRRLPHRRYRGGLLCANGENAEKIVNPKLTKAFQAHSENVSCARSAT